MRCATVDRFARQRKKVFRFDYFFFYICNFLDSDGAKQVYKLLEICSYRARSEIMVASQLHNAHCSSTCQVFGKRMGQYCLRFVEHCHQTIKMSTTAYLHTLNGIRTRKNKKKKKNIGAKNKMQSDKVKKFTNRHICMENSCTRFSLHLRLIVVVVGAGAVSCCRRLSFFHYKNVMLLVLLRLVLKWAKNWHSDCVSVAFNVRKESH